MRSRIARCLGGLAVACVALAPVAAAQKGDVPRTPSGRPDLSGTYDVSTRTPMQRPMNNQCRFYSRDRSQIHALMNFGFVPMGDIRPRCQRAWISLVCAAKLPSREDSDGTPPRRHSGH